MSRPSVRLDAARRQRLEELAAARCVSTSKVVRSLIDGAYEDVQRTRRRQSVERLIGLQDKVPQDHAVLSKELEAAHKPGDLD